jgi:hypothetical protein
LSTTFDADLKPERYFRTYKDGEHLQGSFDLNGPLGNVSFYAQQRRAFFVADLVRNHLEKTTRPEDGKTHYNALVIGAGLSGTTCFLALKAMGIKRVEMVELADRPLEKQAEASHRNAHPHLAEWPRGKHFGSTTNLPFLNWHSGPVDDVIRQIRSDPIWAAEFSKPPGESDVHFGTALSEMRLVDDLFVPKFKQVSGDKTLDLKRHYRSIVWAMGYEENLAGVDFAGYWEVDIAKYIRKNIDRYHDRHVVVTGAGDGAVIEAGNLCVEGGDIERLLLECVCVLRGKHTSEFSPEKMEKSEFEADFARLLDERDASQKVLDNDAFYLQLGNLLARHDDQLERIFAGQGRRTGIESQRKITLMCERTPWVSKRCSPISLLAYHLLVRRDERNIWGQEPKWPSIAIEEKMFEPITRPFDGKEPILIPRHGARSKISRFGFKNFEERNSDDGLGGFLERGEYAEATRAGTYYDAYFEGGTEGKSWKNYRRDLYINYVGKRFPGAVLRIEDDGTIDLSVDFETHGDASRAIGGLDRELHGTTLRYRPMEDGFRHLDGDISNANEAPQ